MKQTYSKYTCHVYDVCSEFASGVLDVWFMFASSCKQGIRLPAHEYQQAKAQKQVSIVQQHWKADASERVQSDVTELT